MVRSTPQIGAPRSIAARRQQRPQGKTVPTPPPGTRPDRCPCCGAAEASTVLELGDLPVQSCRLWPDRAGALAAPRAPIRLVFCRACGWIGNAAFDPCRMAYDGRYENPLEFSPRFRRYSRSLAQRLVRRYSLHGRRILEIGCGRGYFLELLCRIGANHGLGFDPAYEPSRAVAAQDVDMRIVPAMFAADLVPAPPDLVCLRHVLEHIPQPRQFVADVRQVLKQDAVAFFEVPNGQDMLRHAHIWDVIYEHCSYYTPACIRRLLPHGGLEPIAVRESYGGQFLTVAAAPAPPGRQFPVPALPAGAVARTRRSLRQFACRAVQRIQRWRQRLVRLSGRECRRIVLWGAGAKACTFLNCLGDRARYLDYVVDLNPAKHGCYMPGTGQQIVAPSLLCQYRPDLVLLANPLYRREIAQQLAELGVGPRLLAI